MMGAFGLGSVSDYTLHRAPCPVIVVKPEAIAAGVGASNGLEKLSTTHVVDYTGAEQAAFSSA
jgi:Universal stress protein family